MGSMLTLPEAGFPDVNTDRNLHSPNPLSQEVASPLSGVQEGSQFSLIKLLKPYAGS